MCGAGVLGSNTTNKGFTVDKKSILEGVFGEEGGLVWWGLKCWAASLGNLIAETVPDLVCCEQWHCQ